MRVVASGPVFHEFMSILGQNYASSWYTCDVICVIFL